VFIIVNISSCILLSGMARALVDSPEILGGHAL
jgi:hypothetical protein